MEIKFIVFFFSFICPLCSLLDILSLVLLLLLFEYGAALSMPPPPGLIGVLHRNAADVPRLWTLYFQKRGRYCHVRMTGRHRFVVYHPPFGTFAVANRCTVVVNSAIYFGSVVKVPLCSGFSTVGRL